MYKQVIKEQRYHISALLQTDTPKKKIAAIIGVHISTIYRELKRNRSASGRYYPTCAQQWAEEREQWKTHPRKFTKAIEQLVRDRLETEQWSPQQIVGWSKKQGLAMVSHERIYQFIRANKKAGGTLYKHTRHHLKHFKRPLGGGKKISIKNRISIDERPAIVNEKGRFGDWEIDTIIGKDGHGAIVTLTERQTDFLLMEKLPEGKHSMPLAQVVYRLLIGYKKDIHTITSDNGTEFADHEYMAKKLNAQFYFAHPYASWERGLNENTNGLIRQYIPKGTDFNLYSDEFIRLTQNKLNRRPREKLNFNSPSQIFYASLH